MLHGAKTSEEAEAEINQFFPVEKTVAAIKPDAFGTKGKVQTHCEMAAVLTPVIYTPPTENDGN